MTHKQPSSDSGIFNAQSAADELLIDAMLKGRTDSPETTARRVEAAREVMDIQRQNIKLHRWRMRLSTAAAAAVLVLGIFLVFQSPPQAHADFAAVLEAFDLGDKTYQIDISSETDEPEQVGSPRLSRRGMTVKHLDNAQLFIRGRHYVLKYRTGRGRGVTRGFDGENDWLLNHHRRQSVLSNDPNSVAAELPEYINSLLFLDLRQMLHQVQEQYRLSDPMEVTEAGDLSGMQYYAAERISPRGKMPKQIELWFDAANNQLHQITCSGLSFHSPRAPRYTLKITLTGTDALPENWFTPGVHQ